jgi:hypothetical protein
MHATAIYKSRGAIKILFGFRIWIARCMKKYIEVSRPLIQIPNYSKCTFHVNSRELISRHGEHIVWYLVHDTQLT